MVIRIPFTRPISIKNGSEKALSTFFRGDSKQILSSEKGCMVPHRLINKNFSVEKPSLSLIIFPEYKPGTHPQIEQMNAAVGCSQLISCYVNARNIKGHGIAKIAAMVRETPTYHLTYGSFDGLRSVLANVLPALPG